jgi:hypothetical protein
MDNNFKIDEQIKKIVELVQQLRKIEIDEFKEHIENLRNSTDIGVIPFLVELLADPNVEDEKKEVILALVMDVKHPDAVKMLAQGVTLLRGTDELQPYLAALWQNSLTFEAYLDLFVDIVLTADYLTAYDAFTIIENAAGEADAKALELAISTLKDGISLQDESKKPMVAELIHMLEEFKQ